MPTRVYNKPESIERSGNIEIFKVGSDHGMVALRIPLPIARQIAIPGGERPEDLHVSLVYLGDATVITPSHLKDLKDRLDAICSHEQNLKGRIQGYGRFAVDDDQDAIWCDLDAPELPELRHKVLQACRDSAR
jgi:2'-5' RNA ligase